MDVVQQVAAWVAVLLAVLVITRGAEEVWFTAMSPADAPRRSPDATPDDLEPGYGRVRRWLDFAGRAYLNPELLSSRAEREKAAKHEGTK